MALEGPEITRLKIKDKYFPVTLRVSDTRTTFVAEVGDHIVSSSTLEGLKKALQNATRHTRVTVNVPFVCLRNGGKFMRGRVVGVDGRTGRLKVIWEGNTSPSDVASYEVSDSYTDLTKEEEQQILDWLTAKRAIDEQISAFRKTRTFNVEDRVNKMIKAEVERMERDEDGSEQVMLKVAEGS